jgi:hypothetical protein
MKRFAFLAVVACLWSCVLTGPGRAGSIIYKDQFTATGFLANGGQLTPFTNAHITFTGTGDTANVTNPSSGQFNNSVSATVTISGIGPGGSDLTATVTSPSLAAVVIQTGATSAGGFDTDPSHSGVIITSNSLFATYDLKSSFGPVSGFTTVSGVTTNLGVLEFSLPFDLNGTFTAVPEPASLTLLGIGAVGLIGYGWRRRWTAA